MAIVYVDVFILGHVPYADTESAESWPIDFLAPLPVAWPGNTFCKRFELTRTRDGRFLVVGKPTVHGYGPGAIVEIPPRWALEVLIRNGHADKLPGDLADLLKTDLPDAPEPPAPPPEAAVDRGSVSTTAGPMAGGPPPSVPTDTPPPEAAVDRESAGTTAEPTPTTRYVYRARDHRVASFDLGESQVFPGYWHHRRDGNSYRHDLVRTPAGQWLVGHWTGKRYRPLSNGDLPFREIDPERAAAWFAEYGVEPSDTLFEDLSGPTPEKEPAAPPRHEPNVDRGSVGTTEERTPEGQEHPRNPGEGRRRESGPGRPAIDYVALSDELLQGRQGNSAKLIDFMRDKKRATFLDVMEAVQGRECADSTIRALVNRTNNRLAELGSPLRFITEEANVVKLIDPE